VGNAKTQTRFKWMLWGFIGALVGTALMNTLADKGVPGVDDIRSYTFGGGSIV